MSEAFKRVTATLLAGTAGQVIVFLSRLVLVPLYLVAWGTAGYGQWILISSFAAYLGSLDIGVQMYVMNHLTQAHSRGDLAEYRVQQNTAFSYYAALATVVSVALALFAYSADLQRILGTGLPKNEVAPVLVLLGAGVIWALPASIIWNTARTAGNPAASLWLNNLQAASVLLFSGAALLIYPSMKLVAAIPLISVFVGSLVAYEFNRRRIPEIRLGFQSASVRVAANMLRPSAFFGLIVVAVAIGQQLPVLLISHALSVVAVAIFATTRTLTGMIRQLVSLLSNATWTDLTRLEIKGDRERLSSAMRILVGVSMIAVVTLAGVLWFDGPPLIRSWTGGRINPDLTFVRLMLIQVVIQTLWVAASNVPAATNRHRALSISYIVSNVAAVCMSGLLLPSLGLNAIPFSFIIAESVACVPFVLRDACRIAGIDYPGYLLRIGAGSGLMAVGVGLLALVVQISVPGGTFARLAVSALLLPIPAGAIAWGCLFAPRDRERLLGWVRGTASTRILNEPAG